MCTTVKLLQRIIQFEFCCKTLEWMEKEFDIIMVDSWKRSDHHFIVKLAPDERIDVPEKQEKLQCHQNWTLS